MREFWIPKKKKRRNCEDPAADDLKPNGTRTSAGTVMTLQLTFF